MRILGKFNGWQRLWLVCAVIWFVPVVISGYNGFENTPNSSQIVQLLHDPRYVNASAAIKAATFVKYGDNQDYMSANEATKAAIRQRFGVQESQLIGNDADAIEIHSKGAQLKAFALALFINWALPLAVIYALGVATRWVYDGFRSTSG